MPTPEPFETHTDRYERWFDEYEAVYRSELAALRRQLPEPGRGVEIGVGTGRFAAPLGIDVGVDPAPAMLAHARDRGIEPVVGVAEALPVADDTFDAALFVTTICFVDDLDLALEEAERVLGPEGALVVGFVDADSPVGRRYRERKGESPFYRDATFHTTEEVLVALERAGFTDVDVVQTVFEWIEDVETPEPVEEGYGEGSFVAIRATR